MRASIYKIECGQSNLPTVSCLAYNRIYETNPDALNDITSTMNGFERVFDHGALFLICVNDSQILVVQNGTIIATTT